MGMKPLETGNGPTGEPASGIAEGAPDHRRLPTWREWKAQNGSRAGRLEWINYRLKNSPLVEFLEYAGKFAIVAAVLSGAWSGIQWKLEAGDRAKERHYRAWELINAARGSKADGGRRDALQDLNSDHVSLNGAPLEHAYLRGVDLERVDLERANLERANLMEANLVKANLAFANLQGAGLTNTNLQGAKLWGANLQGAELTNTNLHGALLQDASNLTQRQLNLASGNATGPCSPTASPGRRTGPRPKEPSRRHNQIATSVHRWRPERRSLASKSSQPRAGGEVGYALLSEVEAREHGSSTSPLPEIDFPAVFIIGVIAASGGCAIDSA